MMSILVVNILKRKVLAVQDFTLLLAGSLRRASRLRATSLIR